MFVFIELALLIIVVGIVVLFIYRPLRTNTVAVNESNIAISKNKLSELKEDLQNAIIDESTYQSTQEEIKHNLAREIQDEEVLSKPYNKHIIALVSALFLIGITWLVYSQVKFERTPHLGSSSLATLEQYVKDNPNDAKAYQMLGLAFSLEARLEEAITAYARSYELGNREVDLLTEYASALATKTGGDFSGLPAQLVAEAIQKDDKSIKALYLAGIIAANSADLELAKTIWQSALALSKEGSEDYALLSGVLAQLDAFIKAGEAQKAIQVIVDIAPELYQQFFDGFIMIYAKGTDKPMPIAIEKIPLREFVGTVTLSDENSIMPTQTLSMTDEVIITARLSQSGNAIKQEGDVEVASAILPVDNTTVELTFE